MISEISDDNIRYYLTKNCFDPELNSFFKGLLTHFKDQKSNDKNSTEFSKIALIYFLGIILRSREREKSIPFYVKTFKYLLKKNLTFAIWFINEGCNEGLLKELLIECPLKDIKLIISGLFLEALRKISENEGVLDKGVVNFIGICLRILIEYKEKKIMDVFYRLFVGFSKMSPIYIRYLLERKILNNIFNYLSEMMLKESDFNLPKIESNENSELFQNIQRKNQNVKSVEEIAERKKEKIFLENLVPNYTNLIVTLANLICSLKLNNESSRYQIYSIEYTDEYQIILIQAFWRKILQESGGSKIALKNSAKIFGHLCYKNNKLAMDILKIWIEEFNACEDNYRGLLNVYETIMAVEDEDMENKV